MAATRCPHREDYTRNGEATLQKYLARGREMARQKDHFEAHRRETTAELLAHLRDKFAMAAMAALATLASIHADDADHA